MGFEITQAELQMKPKNFQIISDPAHAAKALSFWTTMEELDDVQKVFSNLDIPDEIMGQIVSLNMSKRRRFVVTSLLLSLGFVAIQFLTDQNRFWAIGFWGF